MASETVSLDLSPSVKRQISRDPTGYFRKNLPGFMAKNGGYLRTSTAFKILTGQPYGPSAPNNYSLRWNLGFCSGMHMMRAIRDLKKKGILEKRSKGVYVLTEKGWREVEEELRASLQCYRDQLNEAQRNIRSIKRELQQMGVEP